MKDLNAGFLLDIWHDLKEKRLAPVAVGLVVALIAMPALMLRGPDAEGDVALPVQVAGSADGGANVVVADELADGSKLESYEARDPFKGLVKGGGGEPAAVDGSASAPIDDAGPAPDGTTGGGGSTGGSPPATDLGSPSPAPDGSTGSPNTGSSPSPSPSPSPRPKHKPAFYNFRLDIKFGKPGREKRTRSMSRLSFFYVSGYPVALFLGVDETERNALFLVTPGLNHQGEGKCIPKPRKCNFMSLGIGKEHYLSANNRELRMELLDIKRVKASVDKTERSIARTSAKRRAARIGDGDSAPDDAEPKPYEWPLLVDGVG